MLPRYDHQTEFPMGRHIEFMRRTRGLTWWKADAEGKHYVATEVDRDRFFKEYFSVFSK